MRLAHLILTHTNPEQVHRLVRRLQYDGADFYIHVDLKTDISPFLPIANAQNIYFIKKRVKVNWGGYSVVQATLNGFEEILASGNSYGYINLLSGQDYPLKATADIHKFFENNCGKLFMHALSVESEWREAIARIDRYHLPDIKLKGKHKALGIINKVTPKRKIPLSLTPVGRSQWFTIPPACAAYVIRFLNENPVVSRFFKLSWAPDEMIFQTILYNSPYKKDIINDNLLYVDWSAGGASPKILTMADAGILDRPDKLFARKFNPLIDTEILGHLDKKANFST